MGGLRRTGVEDGRVSDRTREIQKGRARGGAEGGIRGERGRDGERGGEGVREGGRGGERE